MEGKDFCDKITRIQPSLEGDVMTVAEQLEQKGIQKDIQQGAGQKAQETARNFLSMGITVDQVVKGTGLDLETVFKLKKDIDSNQN